MNKKGFTLIEMIAVVIILGIVMLIAVPAVTQYIKGSDDSVYVNSMSSYLQQVKLDYSEKQYGPYINKNEIMVVPLKNIKLDKGNTDSSPFGKIVYSQSYVVVERTENGTKYAVTVLDKASHGFVDKREDELNNKIVEKSLRSIDVQSIDASYRCDNVIENGETKNLPVLISSAVFMYKTVAYKPVEYRIYPKDNYNCTKTYPIIIYQKV